MRGAFEGLLHTEALYVAERFAAHGITADFVARPCFFLDEQHALTFHGQIPGSGRTSRATANHDAVEGLPAFRRRARIDGLLPHDVRSRSWFPHGLNGTWAPFEGMDWRTSNTTTLMTRGLLGRP